MELMISHFDWCFFLRAFSTLSGIEDDVVVLSEAEEGLSIPAMNIV